MRGREGTVKLVKRDGKKMERGRRVGYELMLEWNKSSPEGKGWVDRCHCRPGSSLQHSGPLQQAKEERERSHLVPNYYNMTFHG